VPGRQAIAGAGVRERREEVGRNRVRLLPFSLPRYLRRAPSRGTMVRSRRPNARAIDRQRPRTVR
jgi:hypothetical protein